MYFFVIQRPFSCNARRRSSTRAPINLWTRRRGDRGFPHAALQHVPRRHLRRGLASLEGVSKSALLSLLVEDARELGDVRVREVRADPP
jgi:hypothetical protein